MPGSVLRAYSELRERGVAEIPAFAASVTVYAHHHPDSNSETATGIVARWIDGEIEQSEIAEPRV
jgi:hypothetical protein